MEILITKRSSQPNQNEVKHFKILDYTVLTVYNNTLLLIQDGIMSIDEKSKKEGQLLEIFKVQFIASCKTELKEGVIVAFYIGEYSSLQTYVLGGLPDNYSQVGDEFKLVDYKSYCEICELTGETKLPLGEYINNSKLESVGLNTLLNYNEKFLNHDQQTLLWAELDAK